ncbi:single-stranded DNA-binding protein [Spiroplasma taiwanense]|uniref:Single-stranded DNA-binding protein n=1 Tax=Spiroplasma taiwanense CT-1 TaxID=1276220 RepID=S5LTQ4_9MOLU|nr:single-stranded DNA-binding protein [Spiroplasma taiwanense]AGR41094.1 single-strand DNA-binding protein [Spiroplasma taiwanense CT-1]
MNSVNLIGRITKDPELRKSSGGKDYVAFTVAVNEFSGGNQFTQFVPCFAWEKTAENMAKYVKKGAQIAVEGNLNVRQDNNNGQFSTVISVRANRIQFLASRHNDENQPHDYELVEEDTWTNDDSILWED